MGWGSLSKSALVGYPLYFHYKRIEEVPALLSHPVEIMFSTGPVPVYGSICFALPDELPV
jgi:hypothetical protein